VLLSRTSLASYDTYPAMSQFATEMGAGFAVTSRLQVLPGSSTQGRIARPNATFTSVVRR
jgi:hypothetical protein